MFYTEEEIRELKEFAAEYGYVLDLTVPENEVALADFITVVPEDLLPADEKKAS